MSGKATLHPKHLTMCERVLAANGIRVSDMTADEWLRLALDAEQTARDVGAFDPAYEFFIDTARARSKIAPTSSQAFSRGTTPDARSRQT